MDIIKGHVVKKYKLLAIIIGIMVFFVQARIQLPTGISAERLENVQNAALKQEQRRQAKAGGIDQRSLLEIEDSTSSNRFTQTEGYFQIPALRNLVAETFSGSFAVVNHMDIISRVMAKEAELRKTHWAFYHGQSNLWLVPQDLYTALDMKLNPSTAKEKHFTFMRFEGETGPQATDFLMSTLKKNGLVDDNGEERGFLLSVNLSLFGNTGFPSESTWRYFMKEKKHTAPDRKTYEGILTTFGVNHKYIDEIMDLPGLLEAEEQTLYQIFVPKEEIDAIGYLAWATGIPAHDDTVDWVRTNIKNKTYRGKKGKPGALWALEDLKNKFKKQQEQNPLFKDLIKSVEEGDYSLNSFLKIYCNKPWELPNLNYVQARLIFSKEVLLNPASGVRMYRYDTIKRNKQREYDKRLNDIVKRMVAEKKTGK